MAKRHQFKKAKPGEPIPVTARQLESFMLKHNGRFYTAVQLKSYYRMLEKQLIHKCYNHLQKGSICNMRCNWCNPTNPKYLNYHDHEWGVPNFDDAYLYEMLILESFQAGLSWECILNKREAFKKAYDNFDSQKVSTYDAAKITELLNNKQIIRNRRKIEASIKNTKIFLQITKDHGSFYNYLKTFTNGKIFHEIGKTTSPLSDQISADLKTKGMTFVGSTIIYSYLQAVGVIYSHDKTCELYRP